MPVQETLFRPAIKKNRKKKRPWCPVPQYRHAVRPNGPKDLTTRGPNGRL